MNIRTLIPLLILLLAWPRLVSADDDEYTTGVVLVRLAAGQSLAAINTDYNTSLNDDRLAARDIYLLNTPPLIPNSCDDDAGEEMEEDDFAECLEEDSRILLAQPNYFEDVPEGDPSNAYFWDGADVSDQTAQYADALHNIAPAQQMTQGDGIIVAVLDTGVHASHPYLSANLLAGYDFVADDNTPADSADNVDSDGNGLFDEAWGHGTHVAGIVRYVAPSADILPVRVLDSDGRGDAFGLALGIDFALNQGAHVINLSLSNDEPSPIVELLLQIAESEGVVAVASAGNIDSDELRYPAGYAGVIAVTSILSDSTKAATANYGDWVTVAAAGEGIRSSVPEGNGYAYWSGTSMAAPMVSGLVALLLAADETRSLTDITHIIQSSSTSIDAQNPSYAGQLGAGSVDMQAAVQLLVPTAVDGARVSAETTHPFLPFAILFLITLTLLTFHRTQR